MITLLSNIALVLSLGGNILLAKQNKLVFPVWIVANLLWIVINIISIHNTAQIVMYAVYVGTSAYSWYSWSKKPVKKV